MSNKRRSGGVPVGMWVVAIAALLIAVFILYLSTEKWSY